MRVTLVKPPEESEMNFGVFSLTVLAAAVTDIAELEVLDATDISSRKAAEVAVMRNPSVVGVTAMGLKSVTAACEFIHEIRRIGFKGTVLAGGHGASMLPKAILEKGADAVIYGEGELTFRDVLIRGISDRIRGLFLLKEGHVIRTPRRDFLTLDKLEEPSRELAEPPRDGVYLLETSRGCPHRCTFCESTKFFGNTWRARSPKRVVQDIRDLVDLGALIVQVTDDNFTASPERILEICNLLQNGALPLFFIFSARSDDLIRNSKLIPALAKANFLRVNVGVETLDPQIAQSIRKKISFEQHSQAFAAMKSVGMYSVASFIIGLGETEETRRKYVEFAANHADSATFLPFQRFPETLIGNGVVEPEGWCVQSAERLTKEFRRHPESVSRLTAAAKEHTVRGMLARASLENRLNEGIFDELTTLGVKETLNEAMEKSG